MNCPQDLGSFYYCTTVILSLKLNPFCSCLNKNSPVLRRIYGLVLRNAQMGTAITKGRGGQGGNKKWSVSLVLSVQNWYKRDHTRILFHLHLSNKSYLHFCLFLPDYPTDYHSSSQGGHLSVNEVLDSRAELRIAQGLPQWLAGIELGLSVKADSTQGIFSYYRH